MKYIGNTTDEIAERVASSRIKKIHEKVRRIRRSEKAGIKYMQRWEELEYAREDGKAEGKAEGKADSVLYLLKRIGTVREGLQQKIYGETDMERLERWLELAAEVKRIEEFEEKM